MWKKIKMILTIFFFIIFNFILYYLLKLNDLLYKKISNFFLLIFSILLSNLKYTHISKELKIYNLKIFKYIKL